VSFTIDSSSTAYREGVVVKSIESLLSSAALALGVIATAGCNLYFEDSSGDPEGGRDVKHPWDVRPHKPDVSCDAPKPGEPTCDGTELHVFGSYEARNTPIPPGHPWPPPHVRQDSHIRIDRPGRHRVVVSAYEPTRWLVSAAPGAEIVQVVAVGYHAQEVQLGAGLDAEVVVHSYEQDGQYACGYAWPDDGQGCETGELLQFAVNAAGRPLTSFHGCYQVDSWTLNADLSVQSTCNSEGGGYQEHELLPPPQDDGCSPDQCDDAELHVLGSYEAVSSGPRDPSQPWPPPHVQRDSYVRMDRPGRHKLVLSSSEPVKWHVSAAPGVEITQVIAIGYHAQAVQLAPGLDAAVEIHSYEQDGQFACGYSWPYNGGGCDTSELLAFAEGAAGDRLTSFHGCYQVNDWVINADLSVESNCGSDGGGYLPYEYLPPAEVCEPEADEVQVVGVYQTRADHSGGHHPVGTGRVRVDRPGRQTLVLSSYEPTNWKIEVGPGVQLQAVYATGYHAQTVELPAGVDVPVTTTSYDTGGSFVSCGFRYPGDSGGCNTPGLLAWAAQQTGKPVTSFRGCYDGRTWRIGRDLETTADCIGGDLTEARFDQD
jgi:hypothetical protein